MELLFESRPEIWKVAGYLYAFQHKPKLSEHPVVTGDTPIDAVGAQMFGSVLYDGGRYRMWYAPIPKTWNTYHDPAMVAYAESDDGITWRKPNLGLVEWDGSKQNNLTDMAITSPSVFIDPDSPPSHRYRATGVIDSRTPMHNPTATNAPRQGGYYTAHSADGFHWKLDSPSCRWPCADNISSFYHPGRKQGMALMKRMPSVGGIGRRAFWSATFQNGEWSDWKTALVPDDFDDVAAKTRGFLTADYYHVAQMAAGQATVGFVTVFRHTLPYSTSWARNGVGLHIGMIGMQDVNLVYQAEEGGAWVHTPGRPDFLAHGQATYARGGFYVGTNVVDFGDEQRLYLTAAQNNHFNFADLQVKPAFQICYACWPKWRLFGFQADPQGEMEIVLDEITQPSELILNYEAQPGGSVQVELFALQTLYDLTEIEGRKQADAVPLTGNSVGEVVRWKNGSVIQPIEERRFLARLYVQNASVYAYEVRPVRS